MPANSTQQHAGTNIYVPKINQRGETDDWRYLQGYSITYSPKWISGLSLGFIRWVQMYGALVEGGYPWLEGNQLGFQHLAIYFEKMITMKIMRRKQIKQLDYF